MVTLNLEHNFRDEIFRLLNIPGIKNWELQLSAFINAAYSSVNTGSRKISPYPIKTFPHPFYEVGFGIGHVFISFKN